MPALRSDALRGRVVAVPDDLAGPLCDAGASLATDAVRADLVVGDLRAAVGDLLTANGDLLTANGDGEDWAGAVASATGDAFALARAAHAAAGSEGVAIAYLLADRGRAAAGRGLISAVASLSRSLAVEWAGARTRLNCVVDRGARPGELAAVLAYLASPSGYMMTGQVIEVGHG